MSALSAGQRAPYVARLALQPFASQPREVIENGVARDLAPNREQRERRDGNAARIFVSFAIQHKSLDRLEVAITDSSHNPSTVLGQHISRQARRGSVGQRQPSNHKLVCSRLPPLRHQIQRIGEELRFLFGGGIGTCDAAFQDLQQRFDQDATMCIGGLERFERMRLSIPSPVRSEPLLATSWRRAQGSARG